MEDASSCHFESQEEDEQVILLLRAHKITNLGWVVAVAIFFLVGFAAFITALFFSRDLLFSKIDIIILFLVWLLLIAGFALQRYLSWYFNVYLVTSQKLVDVDFFSLFYKQISETPLENIQDSTQSSAGLLQNHFDYGDLSFQTAGEQEHFDFVKIPDPDGVQKKIMELAETARKSLGVRTV